MTQGWQTKNLGDVCNVIGGGTPSKDKVEFYSGEIPWATVRDMRNDFIAETEFSITEAAVARSATNVIPGGNVVIATRVGLGKVCLLGQDTAINQDLRGIVPIDPETLSVRFLFWWLKSIADVIVAEGTGATVQGVKLPFVKSLQIPLPRLSEQHRIVAILDEAFDGIAIAKANAEKSLQNSREVFRSILNAAITGELTFNWRNCHSGSESASEKLARVLIKRRNQWKGQSKYLEPQPPVFNKPINIPASWVMASPEQLSINIIDCPHSTPKWTETGEICLRTTNFKPGQLDLETVRFVSKETYNERIARLEPKPGDVLYSREGGILGVACIIPEGLKACLGQRMMQFRLDTNVILPMYFASVLNSELILSEVRRLTGGAASPHLNIRDIRTFPIPLPSIEEQQEIISKLGSVFVEAQHLESIYQQKIAALDELKKSLLNQAFSGQL